MSFALAGPDRLLARYHRTGDPRTLGKLFDRTAPELLRVAAWLCGNRTDAEDLLQRTFVTVIEMRGSFDSSRRALPWLCGILGNHSKKLHEQRQRRIAMSGERSGERDPAHAAADAEFAASVQRLRGELGSPYAEVLDLHLGEGLNAQQIAARLERPAGTVRTQLVRGLGLLRAQLPVGFTAGLLLSATATGSALAAVRAAIVARAAAVPGGAAAVATTLTFGALTMGKKIAVVLPALVLLLGGGAWALGDANDALPVRDARPQLATAAAVATTPPAPDAPAAAPGHDPQRAAFDHPDEVAPDVVTAVVVVRATWEHDGSPAANVGVRVAPTQPVVLLDEREGLTDATGRLVLRGIRPGSCIVSTAFRDPQPLTVWPASVTTLDVTLRREGVVRGTVVDGDDRPVANARLWLSDPGDWARGFEVGHSDTEGRFELPVRSGQHVGARKAGYAPSRLRLLAPIPSAPLALRLPSLGGGVRGRVLGADGVPLAAALVRVGDRGGIGVAGSSIDERYVEPTPELLRTDAHGGFVADGVATGSTYVLAWADGHGEVEQAVLVEPGRTTDVVLILPRGGGVVAGVVRDERQRPLARAAVEFGGRGSLGSVSSTTDEQGAFRLENLPAGSVELRASSGLASEHTTLELQPGQVATWNPVLAPPAELAGTLVDPTDRPIAGFQVGVFADGSQVQNVTTGADGRFVLIGVRGPTVDLVVLRHAMGIAERKGVRVDASALVIRLNDAEMPSATVRGRLVDDGGKPIAGGDVTIMHGVTSWAASTQSAPDGTFTHGPLPAGSYVLFGDARGFGDVKLPPIDLAPREHRLLDDVELAPAGRVELTLRGTDQAPRLVCFARDDGSGIYYMSPDGKHVAGELASGGYTALAEIDGIAAATSIVVHAGKTTRAELVFAPAAAIDVEFRGVERRPGDTLRSVARDAAGNVVAVASFDFRVQLPDGPLARRIHVPPGACVLDTRHSDGRVATTAFTAGPASPGEQRVVVELPAK